MAEILERIKTLSRRQQLALVRELTLLLKNEADEEERALILREEQAFAHDGLRTYPNRRGLRPLPISA